MDTIIVDAMGGDFAPHSTVNGAVQALAEDKNIKVVLVGQESAIKEQLDSVFNRLYRRYFNRIEIKHCDEVITMEDKPVEALRKKPNNSISQSLRLLKNTEHSAFISAGNTGAVLSASVLELGRLKNVLRPAIASLLPTITGHTVIVDAGANVECKPEYLFQFGIIGMVYSCQIIGIKQPNIAILSNGAEQTKGTELTRQAYALFQQAAKASEINFSGYVEGKYVLSGDIDVIVTDGFTGNILLKTAEGVGDFLVHNLRKIFRESIITGLAAIMVRPAFKRLFKRIDYTEYGAAPLLGLKGSVFIAHGASSSKAIRNAILLAARYIEKDVNALIEAELAKYNHIVREKSDQT